MGGGGGGVVESPVKKEVESHNHNRNAQWLEERMERMEVNSIRTSCVSFTETAYSCVASVWTSNALL